MREHARAVLWLAFSKFIYNLTIISVLFTLFVTLGVRPG